MFCWEDGIHAEVGGKTIARCDDKTNRGEDEILCEIRGSILKRHEGISSMYPSFHLCPKAVRASVVQMHERVPRGMVDQNMLRSIFGRIYVEHRIDPDDDLLNSLSVALASLTRAGSLLCLCCFRTIFVALTRV